MFLISIAAASLFYLAWSLIALEINYRRASSMGIPLVRLPIDPLNIFFQVFESHAWKILDRLPIPLPTFAQYARRGWYFKDKATSHLKYGPIWALVTPRDIHILLSDAEAVHEVFARRNDFVRPNKMYKLLEVYGPCLPTADQPNWARQRKILATPFNENVMSFVWNETIHQTLELIECWTDPQTIEKGILSVARDSRTLSLNIMAAIGFRRRFKFESSTGSEDIELVEGKMLDYRDALSIVLDNSILLMLLPPQYLVSTWLPKKLRKIGKAAADFKSHMVRMLNEETASLNRGEKGSGSLMTSFVRALDAHSKEDSTSTAGHKGLSIDEIFGNMFVINFAGHDTTANTLAFTMLYLAIHPDIQDWVAEEVREVMQGSKPQDWVYNELFPQLKRCRAILLETLRLHPPILALPKWTNEHPQNLRVGDRTIVIPPYSGVSPSVLASHTLPQYWPEPLVWKPSRWIVRETPESEESVYTPPEGTYYPWSDGPQICLGVRFSQVEFVAILACLLRDHRVSVVSDGTETEEVITARVIEVIENCDFQMLLRMIDPDKITLRCQPIKAE
ncbi:cytochrome P450 monooxygenase [Zopfia rhizophila CBS 207.26]|uniref:Cytochrome P450 monooxygenase n=1 Tax=Zopfia rhizophila CBS 207.26 TaxID=1314779 RepID=A0A6A6E8X3_9PEZI|nr:cytochrome P450 monooxygenase [Zopfia rhizophila CBS 207.26]